MVTFLWILKRLGIVLLHVGSLALAGSILFMLGCKSDEVTRFIVVMFFAQVVYEGWAVYAYLRYRGGRRDEVFQILRAAILSRVPLDTALRMNIEDRKTEPVAVFLQLFFALLITPLVPCALILWGMLYLRRFDRQLHHFADDLHDGMPLDEAVREHPSILSGEARLAVRVGVETGKLELALARGDQANPPAAWLELAPRLVYPTLVFFFVAFMTTVMLVTMVPRFKKIFDEFGLTMPPETKSLINVGTSASEFFIYPAILMVFAIIAGFVAIFSTGVCWQLPIFGHFYRREHRGRAMRMLSLLLDAEMPAPAALRFLEDSQELPWILAYRFGDAADMVERGDTLSNALSRSGALTRSAAAFVASGQTAGTLPWTLRELGEYECRAALRTATRLSNFFAPLMLLAVSGLVYFTVVGIFTPLVVLIHKLGEQ